MERVARSNSETCGYERGERKQRDRVDGPPALRLDSSSGHDVVRLRTTIMSPLSLALNLLWYQIWPYAPTWSIDDIPDLTEKVRTRRQSQGELDIRPSETDFAAPSWLISCDLRSLPSLGAMAELVWRLSRYTALPQPAELPKTERGRRGHRRAHLRSSFSSRLRLSSRKTAPSSCSADLKLKQMTLLLYLKTSAAQFLSSH
jgi:hypothetical protein